MRSGTRASTLLPKASHGRIEGLMESGLRYIESQRVEDVGRLTVHVDADDESSDEESRVGELDGIVVDPGARQVRYFVIDADGPRYLLPLCSTRLDHAENA